MPVRLVALALLMSLAASAAPQEAVAVRESFSVADGSLPEGWRVVRGAWRVEGGALVVDSLRDEACITVGDEAWQNYEVEVRATFLEVRDPKRWLSIVFRAARDGAPPWSQFPIRQKTQGPSGMEFAVRATEKRWDVRARAKGPSATALGRERLLRVVVRGERVTCFLDGAQALESLFCVDRERGCVGLAVSGCRAKFDDFVVRRLPDTPLPRPAKGFAARCLCVAHRGFSAQAPENTLAAVKAAMQAGADGCEFDVYASKDGVAVLMHDAKVDRTTNGKGKVTDLTMAELAKLDAGSWKGKAFASEPVPTLVDVLKAMKGK
ncbi:glycerophosphodiester phosphodiesterase, partial [bacterium]|nr:glycerophosphodiester phosphodiesterase [bacterium]